MILAATSHRFLALDAALHRVLLAEWLSTEHRHHSLGILHGAQSEAQ
jgi:hypothetical protein